MHVSAVTVTNSKFSDSISAGSSASFTMSLSPDIAQEIGIPLTVSMDGGACSPWVSTSTQKVTLTTQSTPVTAQIQVPTTAINGAYACRVQYTSPPSGMVQSRIEVPISLSVTGGKTAPVVVTAPISSGSGGISAQQPVPAVTVTAKPTVASTQAANTQAPVVVETTAPAPIPQPPTGMGFFAAMVATALVVLFAAVIVFDTKRGGKKP